METKHAMSNRFVRGTLARAISFAAILAIALSIAGLPVASSSGKAQAASPVWQDNFDSETLDPVWYWVNENPGEWSLAVNPGFLTIWTSPLPTGGQNLLLRPVADGDFVIQTHVFFEPNTNFQFAGLVIYQDESNFLQFGRAFCDPSDICVGNGIYFDHLGEGAPVNGNFATPVGNPSEAYLRLERRGSEISAYFGEDGTHWGLIGVHTVMDGFTVNAVGLTSSQHFAEGVDAIPADFDYFILMPQPSAASPFVGHWQAIDVDGSDIRLTIAGPPEGPFQITWTESYFSFCEGEAGIVRGTGWLAEGDPNVLEADLHLECFTTGASLDFHATWVYDPGTDTISSGVTTWHRPGLRGEKCLPPPTGLTGWWPGDGNADDIISGANAELRGDATTGSGLVDLAFRLDGDGDFVEVTDSPELNFGTGNFTVDLWVNFTDISGEQVLVEKWVQGDGYANGWTLTKLDNQVLRLAVDSGGGIEADLDSAELALLPGVWYHFAATRQGSEVTLFLNGAPVAQNPDMGASDLSSASSIKFGHRGNPEDTPGSIDDRGLYLNGRIDEVELFVGTALSEEQVMALYSAGSAGKCKDGIQPPAARMWIAAFTYDLPPGSWIEGEHPYHFEFEWSSPESGSFSGQEGELFVSNEAQLYDGYVLLRGPQELHRVVYQGGPTCVAVEAVHPDQPTRFLIGWLPGFGEMTYPQAQAHFESITAQVVWDDGTSADLVRHEIRPFSSESVDKWFDYVCTYTVRD